ncbi:MAG: hypothetical protein ACKO0Z_04940, partial [Betaproteobacteria bacterium]
RSQCCLREQRFNVGIDNCHGFSPDLLGRSNYEHIQAKRVPDICRHDLHSFFRDLTEWRLHKTEGRQGCVSWGGKGLPLAAAHFIAG